MITYTTPAGSNIWDVRGLSGDEKPTDGIPNGSTYYEIDGDHNVYMFDGSAKTWVKQ